MRSIKRTIERSLLTTVVALFALGLALPRQAGAGTYSSLAAFQANIRANSILEPFNGFDNVTLPSLAFGSGGFQVTIDSENRSFDVFRLSSLGAGSDFPIEGTKFTFTGRAVSAFGGTFRVVNTVAS